MGISGGKKKTTNEPWAPLQPAIIKGAQATQDVFDENQPRLQDMSTTAYNAFKHLSKDAFTTNPFVSGAQSAAQNIFQGGMGRNPGKATYDRLQGHDDNPGNAYANNVAGGGYLNAQPSAGLYGNIMSDDYLKGNPYLDSVISQTNADVSKQANRMFGARGMGSGISSAFADVLSKNLADNEGRLRYQNYNDASNRQLQAAGQSDSVWSGERGRMDASTGLLSANHNAAQDRALEAAKSSDAAQQSQVQQMLTALGLTGQLNEAQYAGIGPALSLLNSAADIPYVGTAALNGQIRQASNGYGTTTTSGGGGLLGSVLGGAAGSLGKSLGGAILSDRRAKANIEMVGELADGLGVYDFDYRDPSHGEGRQRGVMADEVERLRPWALGPRTAEGFATVDYGAL